MAPPLRTSGNVGNASRTTLSWTHPVSTQVGDICLVLIEQDGSGSAITAPDANWTALSGSPIVSAGGSRHSAWLRRLATGEPNTSTGNFTWTTADFSNAVYAYYSGCPSTGDPQSVAATHQTFNGAASLVLPSITTIDADCTLVSLESEQAVGDTHTGPGTERQDIDGASLYDETLAAAGASGTRTVTLAGSNTAGGGWLVALKPAGGFVIPAVQPHLIYMRRNV